MLLLEAAAAVVTKSKKLNSHSNNNSSNKAIHALRKSELFCSVRKVKVISPFAKVLMKPFVSAVNMAPQLRSEH
jgi:hypothetical protein